MSAGEPTAPAVPAAPATRPRPTGDAPSSPPTVLYASWVEPELVERVRAAHPGVDVIFEPDLIPSPRYATDHSGAPLDRTPGQEARWRELLARADVLFDFDVTHRSDLPDLVPRLRWIQATSAGIGQLVLRRRYAERMTGVIFTTASGVHARPLAEFALLGMLAFSRDLLTMQAQQRQHVWERFSGTDLSGRTVVVYGHGAIGVEVGRVAHALGMHVIGVKRSTEGDVAASLHADELHPSADFRSVLPRAEFLVLAAPHTPETENVLDADALALLPEGAVLVNIGRGALVDEDALVAVLRTGRLRGAALDVFREEPLPPDSPLWDLPNVLVSPHSAANSERENARITELFIDNLRRFREGRPLRNVLDVDRLY